MKNFALVLVAIMGVLCPLSAQYATVNYDLNRNWFNQGQQLPAETDLVFTGKMPADAEVITVTILSAKRGDVLHTATWHRVNKGDELSLPVNYKLRSDYTYDFQLDFYGPVTAAKKTELRQRLVTTLHAYLEAKQKDGTSIDFDGNAKKLTREMNELIANLLSPYQSRTGGWDRELSDLVALKFERMEKAKLTNGYDKRDTTATKETIKQSNRGLQLYEMENILSAEVDRILSVELLGLQDARVIDDYTTERKPGSLALNLGYGGAFLSGNIGDGTYGSAPYVGVGLPLGNRVLGTKFFRNASLVAGVFVDTFEGSDGQEVKGFLIDQPLYVGLDYKLFQFVHLNAGATTLDGRTLQPADAVGAGNQLVVRPFVGLSARINLALGLGK